MSEMPEPVSRRARARAATEADILTTARRALVEHGPDGLALRAIARELGMTAPALYRYFPSRERLINQVVADVYDELATVLQKARDKVDDPLEQLLTVARQFRRWALRHPQEFGLVFASPVRAAAVGLESDDPVHVAGWRFAAVFAQSFAEIYQRYEFDVPADEDIPLTLRRQLLAWRKRVGVPVPAGALQLFLTGWIRIYGSVCMEVFGHLEFALSDGHAMFEHELEVLAEMVRPKRRP
jgi:AcrR family transcriptional regulator